MLAEALHNVRKSGAPKKTSLVKGKPEVMYNKGFYFESFWDKLL